MLKHGVLKPYGISSQKELLAEAIKQKNLRNGVANTAVDEFEYANIWVWLSVLQIIHSSYYLRVKSL